RNNHAGGQLTTSLNTFLTETSSLSLSASYRTTGYRDLLETLQPVGTVSPSFNQTQYVAGYTWFNRVLGGVTLSYSRSTMYNAATVSRVIGSWSKTFAGNISASVNYQHGFGGRATYSSGNTIYATLSIPLGSASVSAQANRNGDVVNYGVRLS